MRGPSQCREQFAVGTEVQRVRGFFADDVAGYLLVQRGDVHRALGHDRVGNGLIQRGNDRQHGGANEVKQVSGHAVGSLPDAAEVGLAVLEVVAGVPGRVVDQLVALEDVLTAREVPCHHPPVLLGDIHAEKLRVLLLRQPETHLMHALNSFGQYFARYI